jgi:hypothetical protein
MELLKVRMAQLEGNKQHHPVRQSLPPLPWRGITDKIKIPLQGRGTPQAGGGQVLLMYQNYLK